jgi:hypothetical protein
MKSSFILLSRLIVSCSGLSIMILVTACDGEQSQFSSNSNGSQLDATPASKGPKTIKGVTWPKSDMSTHGDDNAVQNIDMGDRKIIGSRKWKNLVWLNFDGAAVSKTDSFIVADEKLDTVTIPPFVGEDVGSQIPAEELTSLITEQVRSIYTGIDVQFVTERPVTNEPVTIIHIGGKSFIPRPGIVGRAPMDFDNFNGSDVGFVFSQEFRGKIDGEAVTLLSQVIAHETAHALGARHIENEKAIMFPNATILANSFDEEGPISGIKDPAPIERSLDVLLKNAGAAAEQESVKSLPKIVNLSTRSKGNIGQFSVFDLKNIEANPRHRLGDFEYSWSYRDLEPVLGPSIRIAFDDGEEAEIHLTVRSGEKFENYVFRIKKP